MSDQEGRKPIGDSNRRLFLEKAGRFSVVTPPAVALLLSATGKARAVSTSGQTITDTITDTVTVTTTLGPT